MKNNKTLLIIILIIAVGLIGFFIGQSINNQKVERFKKMVEITYPEPPEVINKISGTVTDVRGATIYLEINDPEDYLPNLEGEERNRITKYVSVSDETEIIEIDYSLDRGGETIEISDIKIGDEISVASDENIRENEQINANLIEVL